MLVWCQGQRDLQRHCINIQRILKSSIPFVGTHINIMRAIAYIHRILSIRKLTISDFWSNNLCIKLIFTYVNIHDCNSKKKAIAYSCCGGKVT